MLASRLHARVFASTRRTYAAARRERLCRWYRRCVCDTDANDTMSCSRPDGMHVYSRPHADRTPLRDADDCVVGAGDVRVILTCFRCRARISVACTCIRVDTQGVRRSDTRAPQRDKFLVMQTLTPGYSAFSCAGRSDEEYDVPVRSWMGHFGRARRLGGEER